MGNCKCFMTKKTLLQCLMSSESKMSTQKLTVEVICGKQKVASYRL